MTPEGFAELIADFEAATISRSRWTHAAHLQVGFYFVSKLPIAAAANRIREGILRLNAANGVVTTPTNGYHESLTLLYVALLSDFWNHCDRTKPLSVLADEAAQRLDDRNLPFNYYSREKLMSVEARVKWLPPDLRPLPAVGFPSSQ